MDAKQQLALRLRAVRLERGHTQAEVARALGLHRPAVSEIEAGRRSVTSDELAELSRLFSVPVSELLSSAPAPRSESPVGVREVILRMAEVIADRFHPQTVILFGSHARGTADADSDVDLLVVMNVADSRRRTSARIGAALHEFQVPKDIVVTTPDAFQRRREVPGTIERSAALEGEVLHGSR
jgi:transcriptional regulator with XRE-family HTH domain